MRACFFCLTRIIIIIFFFTRCTFSSELSSFSLPLVLFSFLIYFYFTLLPIFHISQIPHFHQPHVPSSYDVRFRSLCRHFSLRGPLAPVLTVRREMSSRLAFSSLNPMTFFFQSLNERMSASSQRGANQINPSLGLEPLICNLISGGCLGHEDTQQGQGLLYREICAFGHSLGFDQQSHPA